MARPKKNGIHITMNIDRDIWNVLRQYSEEKGQTLTLATERILKAYLDSYYQCIPTEVRRDSFTLSSTSE